MMRLLLLTMTTTIDSSLASKLSQTARRSVHNLLADRLTGLDAPTVWHEFSPLAAEYQSVNLGQGFPDWEPPAFVVQAMQDAVTHRKANQYARSYAHMPLAQVLAADYTAKWKIPIDPATQIATAVGCTNALYCAIQGLIGPGDEVILLEPAFDIYSSQVKLAGGVPVYVPLRPANDPAPMASANEVFTLDLKELQNAITEKTKVIVINTPHNPTGKMFSQTELQGIAEVISQYDNLIVISDEVYEHLIYEPETSPHVSMATLPGMFERTLTLSSSGKTFSCTGWKVGWAVGPVELVKAVIAVQQWVNFSAPTPNQEAIAACLQQAKQPYLGYDSYYAWLAAEYKRKRGLLVDALLVAGMNPIVPAGAFFIMADTGHIDFNCDPNEVTEAMPANPMPRDWALSRWLTKTVGVTAIPPSAFMSPEKIPLAANLLRFAFCKQDETLIEARRRFSEYFSKNDNH